MALRLLPILGASGLEGIDLKADREGIRRLVRFALAEGSRNYGMKRRLQARASGWVMRYTTQKFGIGFPIEQKIIFDAVSAEDMGKVLFMRDCMVDMANTSTVTQISRENIIEKIASLIENTFSVNSKNQLAAEIFHTKIFDKETRTFLESMKGLSHAESRYLAEFLAGIENRSRVRQTQI